MPLSPFESRRPRLRAYVSGYVRFGLSALACAAAANLVLTQPALGGLMLFFAGLVVVPHLLARERLRKLLASGKVGDILEIWSSAVEDAPHSRTVGPLARATALAAHGLTERARGALSRAERGQAWDSAIDQRLFIETLLDTFDGDRQRAQHTAQTLAGLPLPTSPWARQRAVTLRQAAGAMARAFARCPKAGDSQKLRAGGRQHPLVFWATSYALAIIRIDEGKRREALALIAAAPAWPEGSAFKQFQQELMAQAATEAAL